MMHAAQARETPARKRSSSSMRRDGLATATGPSQQQNRSNSQQSANTTVDKGDLKPSRPFKRPPLTTAISTSSQPKRSLSRPGLKENRSSTATLRTSNSLPRSQLPLRQQKRVSISNYMSKEEFRPIRSLSRVDQKEEGKQNVKSKQISAGKTMSAIPIENLNSVLHQNFELASEVFQKAAAKYGARLSHRQVDGLIRKSEHSAHIDKATKKMIKQMLFNFERTGYDATKTVQLELVKIELSRLAREHHMRTLLTKGIFSLMRETIERRQKDPSIYLNRTNDEFGECNTTLHRLLEGVISSSKVSELQEFIQMERTLDTEMSETLTSEPALFSPPILDGMCSPSVNDLQGQALPEFYQDDKDDKIQLSSTLLSMAPIDQQVASDNNYNSSALLFLGGPAGLESGDGEMTMRGPQADTHVKIANLFQTTVNSASAKNATQEVEKQLLQLDGAADRLQTQISDMEDSSGEVVPPKTKTTTIQRQKPAEKQTKSLRERRKEAQQVAAGRYKPQSRKSSLQDRSKSRDKKEAQPEVKPKHAFKAKAKKPLAPTTEPATTERSKALRQSSQEMKTEELDVPVRPERDDFCRTQHTSVHAPRFQSCFSSPQSRLRSILTDNGGQASSHKSVHHSHQTSRRTSSQINHLQHQQQPTESWQSRNQRKMLLLEQGGVHLRKKFLMRRALKSLEANVSVHHQLEQKVYQFIQRRVFQRLRQHLYNRRRRHEINQVFAQSRHDKLVAQTFRDWRSLFFEQLIVRQCQQRSLKKKGFEALLAETTNTKQNRQINIVCRQHFQQKLLRSIMIEWKERAENNRSYRSKSRMAIVEMRAYRMARIVKGWFNLVDLLKHEHALQSDMLQSRASRLKRHYFVTWLQGYMLTAKRRDRFQRQSKFSKANFARRYFTPWLRLSRVRNTKRSLFFEMRGRHLLLRAFSALRNNISNNSGERKRARHVLLLRAERLIRTTFYDGLLAYCKNKKAIKVKNSMVERHRKEQLTFISLTTWRTFAQNKRKGKSISAKTNFVLGSKYLNEWLSLTKNVKKARQFRSKTIFERQFQVLKALYENANTSKVHKTIIEHCLNRYSALLLKTSLKGFSEHINSTKAKNDIVCQIDDYYTQKLRQKSIIAWCHYLQQSKIEAQIVRTFQLKQLDTSLAVSFSKLKAYRVDRQFKRSYKPIVEHRQTLMRERCFAVLVDWRAERKDMKQKLSGFHNYKREQMLEIVLETLSINARYSIQKKSMQVQADGMHRRNLLFKVMETLNLHTECKQNQHALVESVHRVQRKSIFISWFNLVHDKLPKTRQADDFQLRVKFNAFRALIVRNRPLKAKKTLLKQLSLEFYPYMLKKRGVCKWRANSEYAVAIQERITLSRKRRLQRLFDGWWNNVDKLAQDKSRDIMQRALNKCFHLRRGLTGLSMHAQEKKHEKQIIKIYQTKQQMVEKARVFSAIVHHCYNFKVVAREFINRVRPHATIMINEAFLLWKERLAVSQQDDKANLFQEQSARKFFIRKYFEKLRIVGKDNVRRNWLSKIRSNHLKRQSFRTLVIHAKRHIKKIYARRLATNQNEQQLKYLTMRALVDFAIESRRLKGLQGNIQQAYNKIKLRKVVLALRSHTARALRGKLMAAKWGLRIKDKFLARWQERQIAASKLRRLFSIMQDQNYLTFIRAFMLKLENAGEYMALKKRLDIKLQAKAYQAFKQEWLLGRMASSLVKRYERDLQVKVFMVLRNNKHQRIGLRDAILRQVNLQSVEDDFDVARFCFDTLKQNRYTQRAKRVARGTFGLSILRKGFQSLRDWTIKRKLLQVAHHETVLMKKHRMFQRWITEYDKSVKGREANAIINFDRVHMVMDAWKQLVHNSKLVRQFREETYHRRLKRTAMASLERNVVIKNFQNMVYRNVKSRTNVELMRDAFIGLCGAVRLRKIQSNMKQFHLQMFKKKVLRGWRSFTDRNNKRRLDLIQQRAALRERPYLKRPLLAMRNMLLYRAFRSIALNANKRQAFRFNRQICTFSLYLRLQRKAFYAIRLNAAQIFQKRKSKEIKRLMIQRRWFSYLKRVIRLTKLRRKRQTDAAIFRFLSLQRRAVVQWVNFVTTIKRIKIKRHFALTLYYNRMCDKVFTALKVNAMVKARKRQDMSSQIDAQGYITTSSSEIMHEASFTHRNKLTMSSLQQFASMAQLQAQLQLDHNVSNEQGFSLAHDQVASPQSPQDDPQYPDQADSFEQKSRNGQMEHHQTQHQYQQHHQQQYLNFYQQPLDQVEAAEGVSSQQELVQRTLFQEIAMQQQTQQATRPQNIDALSASNHAFQSLPTPPAQPDFRGFFPTQSQQQKMQQNQEQAEYPYHQYGDGNTAVNGTNHHMFSGDMSQPQQLTLGTMPEQQERKPHDDEQELSYFLHANMQQQQQQMINNNEIAPPYYQSQQESRVESTLEPVAHNLDYYRPSSSIYVDSTMERANHGGNALHEVSDGYEAAFFSPEDNIQLDVNAMNLGIGQGGSFSDRSTPEIDVMVPTKEKSYHHSRNMSSHPQSSNPYSHSSSLKTTPGMVKPSRRNRPSSIDQD